MEQNGNLFKHYHTPLTLGCGLLFLLGGKDMATNLFSIIGLYIAMVVYMATGVVDPSIFGNWFADVFNMF
jgi:hypothetical protein